MAQIIIEVPDAQVLRVLDAFATQYGYDPITFPEHGTRAQFAKRQIAKFVRSVVLAVEQRAAQADAIAKMPPVEEVQAT